MANVSLILRSVVEAVRAKGLRALARQVPLVDSLFDIAEETLRRIREAGDDQLIREQLQLLAETPTEEVREAAEPIVANVLHDRPAEEQQAMIGYLTRIPEQVHLTMRRADDPTGRTLPAQWSPRNPADLLLLLPQRLPRFRAGDRPRGIGSFELVQLLGFGTFGEVWRARNWLLPHEPEVALKFCLDEAAIPYIRREAALISRVMRSLGDRGGIVRLRNAFHLEEGAAEPPCLAYEFVGGGDLSAILVDWRALSKSERHSRANQIVAQLAAIVGAAHRLQPPIVHRDLKPANVLLDRSATGEPRLAITDFGIGDLAYQHRETQSQKTNQLGTSTRGLLAAANVLGAHTDWYASPQQKNGDAAEPRDDVHALGVIWYQLLIGDCNQVVPREFEHELREEGVPSAVIELVARCVSSKATRRPADAQELAQLIEVHLPKPAPPPVQDKSKVSPNTNLPLELDVPQPPVNRKLRPKSSTSRLSQLVFWMSLLFLPLIGMILYFVGLFRSSTSEPVAVVGSVTKNGVPVSMVSLTFTPIGGTKTSAANTANPKPPSWKSESVSSEFKSNFANVYYATTMTNGRFEVIGGMLPGVYSVRATYTDPDLRGMKVFPGGPTPADFLPKDRTIAQITVEPNQKYIGFVFNLDGAPGSFSGSVPKDALPPK